MKLSRIYNELINVEWVNNKDLCGSKRRADVVLNYFGDDRDIRSIDYAEALKFIEWLKKQGYGGSTINRYLAALSKMFTVAQRHDRKVMRPEIPRQKEGKPRKRVFTDDEVKSLVEYPWARTEFRDLTVLMMDTGVRPSEILTGEWTLDGDEITLIDTKNGDDRTLLLTDDALAAAKRLKKGGKRIAYTTYGEHFRAALKELNIEGVVPYTIRHSVLTKLANDVDNVLLIQKWAGHRSLATTQRYVKPTRKGMERLTNALVRR